MNHDSTAPAPSFAEALRTWGLIGMTSFGGPAGQIALMHRILVEEKRWLDERTYLLALNFCTLLPGPEAMQLATFAGWRLHGTRGGLAAGLLFVLPGATVILILSALYAQFGSLPLVTALFGGIKAAVLSIVIEALLRISKRSLKDSVEWVLAALSFLAIYFLKVPFPIIVLLAAVFGFWRGRNLPGNTHEQTSLAIPIGQTASTILIWTAIWLVPLAFVAGLFGMSSVMAQLAIFFSKLAVVTFGGAYAVLAYMAQDVVQIYGWLHPGEMMDGLGLAETTPGPLILVTEFVGFLAAYRSGGGASLWLGVFGALVTLWATFAPCFLYIFAGAPYIEQLKSAPRLKSALSAITASVVGVILNLSVWFALHVLFRRVPEVGLGPLTFPVPDVASMNLSAVALALLAAFMLFRLHVNMMKTLAVSALLGAITSWAAF